MTGIELLVLLVVAGVCGGIGQALGGYSRGGCLAALALGFIGALLGRWVADAMDLPELFMLEVGGHSYPIVWSIIGATLFVVAIGMLTRRRR